LFSIGPQWGITTTSFTKAYGFGGLKAGFALASDSFVDILYANVLNTVGCGSNLVEAVLADLLTKGKDAMEKQQRTWAELRRRTEHWLKNCENLSFVPNRLGVTFWVDLEKVKDTYQWANEFTIPKMGLSTVPGAFFLYTKNYAIVKSNQTRLGIGNIQANKLEDALSVLENAINQRR